MEIYLDVKDNINEEKLKEIANGIKNGKIAIFPTETVYGIGTNGLNEKAVDKIYEIKKRDKKNPTNLLVSSIEMIETITQEISPIEYKLMEAFFPGPFTIILKKNDIVPNVVTAGSDLVGVRMPSGMIAKKLVELSGVPIATPSANISGDLSGTSLNDIIDDFSQFIDYVVDGGKSEIGIESTVVRVIDDIAYVLRPGLITPEQIKAVAGNCVLEDTHLPSSNLKHYQLKAKSMLIYSSDNEKMVDKINCLSYEYENCVVLCCSENKNLYNAKNVIDIGSKNDLETISRNLFSSLQKASSLSPDMILIEGVEQKDLGIAIMNRLLNCCNNNYIEL